MSLCPTQEFKKIIIITQIERKKKEKETKTAQFTKKKI